MLGDLSVDLGWRQVFVSEKVQLTPIDYKLLTRLIRYVGEVLTHRRLLKEAWGPLHVEEGQLRNKLERNPIHTRYLVTELGVGYRLRTENLAGLSLTPGQRLLLLGVILNFDSP